MRKNESKFVTKCISNAGSFNKNRDFNGFVMLENYGCWVSVDGLDTCDEKNSAELVATSIIEDFTLNPGMSDHLIKKYIKNAHDLLKEFNGKYPLNASLTMLLTDYSDIKFSAIGNTRFYHFRKNKIIKKSKDESVANLLLELGEIDSDSVFSHTHKNTLYNYVGKDKSLKIDISPKINLLNDDVLLLGTIGMWENIDEKEIPDILKGSMNSEEFAENLEYMLKKNGGKSLNNYSITSIFVQEVFNFKKFRKKQSLENPRKKINFDFLKNRYVKRILLGLLIAMIALAALGIKQSLNKKKQQSLEKKESEKTLENGNIDLNVGDFENSLKKFEEAKLKYKDDPEKLKEIDEKIRLIKQAIIGQNLEKLGDDNVTNKNYDGALINYQKALQIYNETKTGDIQKINEKINKNNLIINILKEEKLADEDVKNQNFSKAKSSYESILNNPNITPYPEVSQRINNKISNLSKIQEADTIVESANALYRKGQYSLAKNKYESSLSIYRETNQANKVSEIKNRIDDIESLEISKLNNEAKKLEDLGDDNIESKQYQKAKENYRQAYDKYSNFNKDSDANRVLKKIDSISLFEKYDTVKNYEIEGDNFYTDKEYKKAIQNYEKARDGYQELNRPNEVSICEDKIKKAKKKDKVLGIF